MSEVAQRPAGALAIRPSQTDWTPQQRAALSALGIDDTVTAGELQVFLTYAQRTGLDPFARQIHMVKRKQRVEGGDWKVRWSIQTGIDGFRVIAARSGKYRGQTPAQWCGPDGLWVDVWLKAEYPAAARAGVIHADYDQPLYAVATWHQYAALTSRGEPQGLWGRMPALMLHKCAEALALRRAFPHDLSGMYIAEEMDQQGRAEAAEPAEGGPSLADLTTAAMAAESVAELQTTWREAAAFNLLDEPLAVETSTGEVVDVDSLRDLLMRRAGELQPGEPSPS
jgi:phage recombination protein Bet